MDVVNNIFKSEFTAAMLNFKKNHSKTNKQSCHREKYQIVY